MKRDVDLIRQLLFEIERQGAECSLELLRNAATHEFDERTRYHLRLLIDAGLAKEIDRSAAGVPCVRLSSAGHEFLDVCRGDERWQAAKWLVHEQTGGLSLTVLRAVLTKWAVDGIARAERHRRWRRSYRPYDGDYYAGPPADFGRLSPGEAGSPAGSLGGTMYRVDSYRYEREPYEEEEPLRLVRPRRDYREAIPAREFWNNDAPRTDEAIPDEALGVSLPINMI